jgi:putative transposase
MGNGDLTSPTPTGGAGQSVGGKLRARKRPRSAPTHMRSWPPRPDPAQCRDIQTRFFAGARAHNAVLGEFIGRSRAVKSDPLWQAARQLPHRTTDERAARRAAVAVVQQAHRFSVGTAQSFACGLPKSWVREDLSFQETQNCGVLSYLGGQN